MISIDVSQEILAIDIGGDGFKILSEASSQACSAIVTTIWRPGFKDNCLIIEIFDKGPVKLIKRVKIAHSFSQSVKSVPRYHFKLA